MLKWASTVFWFQMAFLLQRTQPGHVSVEKQKVKILEGTRAYSGEGAQAASRVPAMLKAILESFIKPFSQQEEEEVSILGVSQLM